MLVDEKKVEWDAPVTRYLPWFQLKDPAATRELMVRDLLTHRAGLGNADYLWYGQTSSTDEILRRVRLIDPAYPIRSGFIYQNIMYAAAGAVIEAASGKPWAEMLKTRILEPLGMTETIPTAATLASHTNVASPHDIIDGKVTVIENASVDPVAAAGAVWSNVNDMAKWMQFLLDGGRVGGVNGTRLLSEKSFAELFTPQTIAPFDMYPTTRHHEAALDDVRLRLVSAGLSRPGRRLPHRQHRRDGRHSRADPRRASRRLRARQPRSRGAAPRDHVHGVRSIRRPIRSRLERRVPRPCMAACERKADEERAKKEAQRVRGTSPSVPIQKLAGTYADPLHGDVIVTSDAGGLHIQYGSAFVGTLEHWHYNTFRATWKAAWRDPEFVTFDLDDDGQPHTLEMMHAHFTRR